MPSTSAQARSGQVAVSASTGSYAAVSWSASDPCAGPSSRRACGSGMASSTADAGWPSTLGPGPISVTVCDRMSRPGGEVFDQAAQPVGRTPAHRAGAARRIASLADLKGVRPGVGQSPVPPVLRQGGERRVGRGEVRRADVDGSAVDRSAGHPAPDPPTAIEHHDRQSRVPELPGGGDSRDAGAHHDDWIHLLMLSGPSTSSGRRRCRNITQGPAKEHPMSDMSTESAPSGGDPLEIVPDLTEGDDAAPGDEAGLRDETGASPRRRPSRCGRGRRSRRPPGPAESRWHPTWSAGWDVRLRQRVRPDAGHRRYQRLRGA